MSAPEPPTSDDHREQAGQWLGQAAEQERLTDPHLQAFESIRKALIGVGHALLASPARMSPRQVGWFASGRLHPLETTTSELYHPIPVYVFPDEIPQVFVGPGPQVMECYCGHKQAISSTDPDASQTELVGHFKRDHPGRSWKTLLEQVTLR